METIADLINEVVTNIKDEALIAKVRSQVNELMSDQPLFKY
jgi:glycine hydroxymethyltransferase